MMTMIQRLDSHCVAQQPLSPLYRLPTCQLPICLGRALAQRLEQSIAAVLGGARGTVSAVPGLARRVRTILERRIVTALDGTIAR